MNANEVRTGLRVAGDAVHGGVLDSGIRHSGGSRLESVPGERARNQESAREKDRRAREPVADEVAHLRMIAEFVPAVGTNPADEDLLAAAE